MPSSSGADEDRVTRWLTAAAREKRVERKKRDENKRRGIKIKEDRARRREKARKKCGLKLSSSPDLRLLRPGLAER